MHGFMITLDTRHVVFIGRTDASDPYWRGSHISANSLSLFFLSEDNSSGPFSIHASLQELKRIDNISRFHGHISGYDLSSSLGIGVILGLLTKELADFSRNLIGEI